MTDNSDGTYSYSYSLSLDGVVTVFVYKESYIIGTYYDSLGLTGATNIIELADFSNPISVMYFPDNSIATASAEFTFNLVVTEANTYTISASFNDAFNLTIGNKLNFTSCLFHFIVIFRFLNEISAIVFAFKYDVK